MTTELKKRKFVAFHNSNDNTNDIKIGVNEVNEVNNIDDPEIDYTISDYMRCNALHTTNPNLKNFLSDNTLLKKLRLQFKTINTNTLNDIHNFIESELEKNKKAKKILCTNSLTVYKNLNTSFVHQLSQNKEFIEIEVFGCTDPKKKPSVHEWINNNKGRIFGVNCFIEDKINSGTVDIKIDRVSPFKYDKEFKNWDGGNKLIIKCHNPNYKVESESESDTDIDN